MDGGRPMRQNSSPPRPYDCVRLSPRGESLRTGARTFSRPPPATAPPGYEYGVLIMEFDDRAFARHMFPADQVRKNLANANKDVFIARQAYVLEVTFRFACSGLIKAGIALLSALSVRATNPADHHARIIEKLAEVMGNPEIEITGNMMLTKRNQDYYTGGLMVGEREAAEFLKFVESVLRQVETLILARIVG
jgi:hypothetical protein